MCHKAPLWWNWRLLHKHPRTFSKRRKKRFQHFSRRSHTLVTFLKEVPHTPSLYLCVWKIKNMAGSFTLIWSESAHPSLSWWLKPQMGNRCLKKLLDCNSHHPWLLPMLRHKFTCPYSEIIQDAAFVFYDATFSLQNPEWLGSCTFSHKHSLDYTYGKLTSMVSTGVTT